LKKLNAKNKKLEKICINLNINGFFLKRDFFKRQNYQKKKRKGKRNGLASLATVWSI
jgi:hypothetical protein